MRTLAAPWFWAIARMVWPPISNVWRIVRLCWVVHVIERPGGVYPSQNVTKRNFEHVRVQKPERPVDASRQPWYEHMALPICALDFFATTSIGMLLSVSEKGHLASIISPSSAGKSCP
jgi:hypothetical protein